MLGDGTVSEGSVAADGGDGAVGKGTVAARVDDTPADPGDGVLGPSTAAEIDALAAGGAGLSAAAATLPTTAATLVDAGGAPAPSPTIGDPSSPGARRSLGEDLGPPLRVVAAAYVQARCAASFASVVRRRGIAFASAS